jgi:hypothetical protein
VLPIPGFFRGKFMSIPQPTEPADLPMVRVDGEIIEPTSGVSPEQAKVNAIASVTMSAYAKASELKLTDEEDEALAKDFPDEAFRAGAGGDDRLIYIEHAFLRDRLNDVLGRGAWALVTRSKWTENFKTSKGADAVRVYAEVMLMVRGCYVGEAVGEMEYYPHNAKTTYADAIEGSKTAAFRRCAKDFGIGLQAWKKTWCEGWWARKAKNGGKPAAQVDRNDYLTKLIKRAEDEASKGIASYQEFWEKTLTKNERGWLKDEAQRLKAQALASPASDGDAKE